MTYHEEEQSRLKVLRATIEAILPYLPGWTLEESKEEQSRWLHLLGPNAYDKLVASIPWNAKDRISFSGTKRRMFMETDFELIDRYQGGDESAFSALIERHQRLVYRLCWQYMGEHAEADDAAQDTFFKAFQHLRTFRRDSSFKTWLYQIAVNTCKNRQRVKTFEALPEQMPAPDAGNPFHTTLAAEKKALLSKLICRLPARQRDTVSLRLRDLGFDAIGALLGCTAGTAKVNYYHGRTSLRRMVQQ